MQINIRKILTEFVTGFGCCLLGYLIAVGITLIIIDLGRLGTVLLAFFLGYPLGSILGIVLADKVYYKTESWNRLGIGLSIVLSLLGGYLGFILLVKRGLGGYASVIVPLIITLLSLLGYNTPAFLMKGD